jgi:branched-chain amino acid transport system ATP-binding protein
MVTKNPLLEVNNIDVFYGSFHALYDVSLNVYDGEIISLIGANGMGKTTIINAVSGVIHPKNGKIVFRGVDITTLPPYSVLELGIVQVPEGRRIFPNLSVKENLDMGCYISRARAKKHQLLKRVYEMFPVLEERKNQPAGTLSGGEQQMLAIGRGLMADPQLLIVDEISLGLAPVLVNTLIRKVREINQEGVTIMLVDENVSRSLSICTRAYIVKSGRIVLSGTRQELENVNEIKKAYFGL